LKAIFRGAVEESGGIAGPGSQGQYQAAGEEPVGPVPQSAGALAEQLTTEKTAVRFHNQLAL